MLIVHLMMTATLFLVSLLGVAAQDEVDFNRDVRPILSANCFKCHGPDANKRKAKLRLDQAESALAAKAIVPGRLGESELWMRINHADPDERMPPVDTGKKLTPKEIVTLGRWIKQGGEYKSHWAYITPERPKVPGGGHPVDAFIRARLKREGLKPSAEADRATLLRRLSLDLTGLPPTVDEVKAFKASGDYEKQVDRLLASEHYGERMAINNSRKVCRRNFPIS